MPYRVPYKDLRDEQKQRLRDNAKRWNQEHKDRLRSNVKRWNQEHKNDGKSVPTKQSAVTPRWALIGHEVKLRYLAGESPGDLAKVYNLNRTTIKEYLKRCGILRSQSDASLLACSQGKKQRATDAMIYANRYDLGVRFNPAKTPWKGNPTKNPRWIKDRTKLKNPRTRVELRVWRETVMKRDDYTCQLCGQRGGRLNADHIKSYVMYPELREVLENGRTLCEPCHRGTPNYGAKARKVL